MFLVNKLLTNCFHRACGEHLSQNPNELSTYYGSILGSSTEFVRNFGAKTFVIIFRKLKVSVFTKHMKKVLKALAVNIRGACEDDIDKISFQEKNDQGETADGEKRSKWLIHGMSRLLYITFKGIKGEIHSKAIEKIHELLAMLSSHPYQVSDPDMTDAFFLKATGGILHRCLFLLHNHLTKENQRDLVMEEVEFLSKWASDDVSSPMLRSLVLEFSPKLLSLILTAGHAKALSDASTRKVALPKLNDIACSLLQKVNAFDNHSIDDWKEMQQLFCTVWILSPSSKKLSATFNEVLPSRSVEADDVSVLCECISMLSKLPREVYFSSVISAVAALFQRWLLEKRPHLHIALSHVLVELFDARENSDSFSADTIENAHDYSLRQFQEHFHLDDWAPVFSAVLSFTKRAVKKELSVSSELAYALRVVSWMVRVLSRDNLRNFVDDIAGIVTSVSKLLATAKNSTGEVDYCLFSLVDILCEMLTTDKSIMSRETLHGVFRSTLQLTISRQHSLYQSHALSQLLQHHIDGEDYYLSEVFEEDALDAFCTNSASSLAGGTFWERINLLRILKFVSPPVLGAHLEAAEHDVETKTVDVVGLMLELASLPVSLKNEREIHRRFETLEVLCRGNKLPKPFLSLIAGFCLGMFRTKFKPVWSPATAVLVTIAQHDDGEDILWPFLHSSLNKYSDSDGSQTPIISDGSILCGEFIEQLWRETVHDKVVIAVRNTPLFPFHVGRATKGLTVAPDSVADAETTFLQLLEFLSKASNITIKRSKFVVGIFISFLHDYYSVFKTDVEIPYLTGIGLLEQSLLEAASTHLSRKNLRSRLVGYLKMFAATPGPKQLFKNHLLYIFYHELICKSDIDVAKLAFDCICGYKPANIIPYKEHLKNLFDDRKFRNELLEISASLTDKEGIIFAPEHQTVTFQFVVRILYGLLLSKPTTSRKEKDAIKSRRAAIFSFVAQLGSDSAEYLMYFMLRGLLPGAILQDIPSQFLEQRNGTLDNKMSDALLTSIHGHVLTALKSSDKFHFNDASWDRLKGYLYSLQPAFANIGFVLSSMVPLVYKTLRMIISLCTKVKMDSHAIEDVDVEEDADETAEQEDDDNKEEHAHKDVAYIVEMKVSSECRTLAMRRMAEMLDQYHKIFDFTENKEDLMTGLAPLLQSLYSALHSSHKTPAILILLHRFAQYPSTVSMFVEYHDQLLNNCISCLSITKLHTESARMLIQIFTHVLNFSGSEAFLPYAELIVSMLVRRLQGPVDSNEENRILKLSEIDVTSLGSVREEVDFLCRIATDIFSREDAKISTVSATNFATIILGILRSYTNSTKTKITEDWVINMLLIYRSFVPRMENVSGHVSFFSRTFGPTSFAGSRLNNNGVRAELLITYGILCEHPSVSKVLSLSFTVLSSMMKQDVGIVESRDYNSFVPAVQALSSAEGGLLKDVKVSWDTLIGPSAYARQGKKSKRSISEHVAMCSAVVFDLVRCVYDAEMAIRSSATIALKTLVTEASSWIASAGPDWACVFQSFLTPAIRKGVQQSPDLIKTEYLSLFSHYIATAAASEHGAMYCDHIDLAFLRNEDRDSDFFHNITHIQVHRRARAFLRLHRLLRDPTNTHQIGVPSFVHILLPLTVYYLTSEEYTKKAHLNLMEEVTQLIGAICSHLPWSHYMNTFRKMIRFLQRADENKLKIMQSVVCVVLDNFHFSLNDGLPTAMVVDDSNEVDEEDSDDKEGDADDTAKEEDDREVNEVVAVEASTGGKNITNIVVNQILPTVKHFLLREVKDHKGNKTEEVQTNIAVALTNLLLHLQPPAVTEEERMRLFSSLVIKVVNTLKSRDSNIRDAARHCLAKMINILGLAALRPVVYELQSNLREGFQRHVAAYSLRSILWTVLENYQAPQTNDEEALRALVQGQTEGGEDGTDLVVPDFDKALDLIMQFVLEDISSDMKEDRESEGALRTMIREQKGVKFREILEIVARCLLFRPTFALQNPSQPQLVSSIHAVSMPLLDALQAGEDSAYTGRVTEALTQVATGLSKNASIRDKELLLYVHATLQPFVTQMLGEYRRYREALGKLVAPTKKGKAAVSGVDDESDFEVDLPSYLREEESDDEEKFAFMREEGRKPKDDDPDAINKQRAATWLPTDARSLKDQRAVVEARNQEQRDRVRVQDGASAPKLTGRNRYDLAHRKGKNAAGISKVTLVAIKFCLSLMQSSLKRGIFSNTDEEIKSMMVPFIPLLRSFLHIPNASEVVALSIKVIGSLVNWGVPLDTRMHARLTNRVLLIMIRHCASISTENELCQACIKTLVSMFKHFNDQVAQHERETEAAGGKKSERPKFPLDEFKLRSLVEMLTVSITDITSSFQNPAFQLIKEIIRSRVLLPEIYDLIKKLTEQIVLSHRKGIRETSSQIVIAFMITYPMGNKRSESQLVQLLNNCNYEFEEGRSSAMETIFHILRSFPIPVIEEHAYRFFFPMTLKLVNETSRVCRDWATQILSILFRRIMNVDLLQQFHDFAMKWLGTIVNTAADSQNVWTEETTAVVRTGAQVMSIFARSRMDLAGRAETVKSAVEVSFRTLTLLRTAEDEEAAECKAQGKEIILPRHWYTVYHVVSLLEHLLTSIPGPTDTAIAQVGGAADSSTLSLMEQALDLLVYRHVWVRSSAARLLNAYFQRRSPQRKRLALHPTGHDLFHVPNICYQLGRKLCLLLNQSTQLPTGLLDTIGQNLAYVVQVMVYHPELDTFAPESKEEDEDDVPVDGEDEEPREADEDALLEAEDANEDEVDDDDSDDEADEAPEAVSGDAEGEESPAQVEGGLSTVKVGMQFVPTSNGHQQIPGTTTTTTTKKKRARGDESATAGDSELMNGADSNIESSQRRGLTWVMHRLRAIGADVRGHRRWHVVRCLQQILQSQVLSSELLQSYAELIMEPLVRVMSAAQDTAQQLAREAASGRDTAALEEQQKEHMDVHVLSKDLLQVLEEQLTPTVYLEVFTKVQTKLQRIKSLKRQQRKALAVSNPALFNRMRVENNQRKKFGKKRRIQDFKQKRGQQGGGGMRKKPRRA